MTFRPLWLTLGACATLTTPAFAQKEQAARAHFTAAGPVAATPRPPVVVEQAPVNTARRPSRPSATATPVAAPLAFGQSLDERLNADGRCVADPRARYYSFTAAPNTRIELTMQSRSFDTVVAIGHFDGCDFESIASNDDGGRPGDGTNSRLIGTLVSGGSYIVKAAALGDGVMSGSYSIALNRLPAQAAVAAPAPLPLRIGTPASGRLGAGDPVIGDRDGASEFISEGGRPYRLYSLTGRAGQTINLALDSDDFDSFLEVGSMSPLGFAAADSNDDGEDTGLNSRLTVTFPTAGTMIVRVSPLGRSSSGGRYTLTATTGAASTRK